MKTFPIFFALMLLGLSAVPAQAAVVFDDGSRSYRWTDDLSAVSKAPAASTSIKALHAQEIHDAVDDARVRCGLMPLNWSLLPYNAASQIAEGQPVLAEHVSALRAAVAKLYEQKGMASSGVPASGLAGAPAENSVWLADDAQAGSAVQQYQLQDLRLALDYLAQNSCGAPGAPGCAATECDSAQLGMTTGGICGCNPAGSTLETIGPGCRLYKCKNGAWMDIGAPGFCQMAATCS